MLFDICNDIVEVQENPLLMSLLKIILGKCNSYQIYFIYCYSHLPSHVHCKYIKIKLSMYIRISFNFDIEYWFFHL